MKRILCYGDSNTWGYNPESQFSGNHVPARFPEDVRWTGRLANLLGDEYVVIEEGLDNRTTCFRDPGYYGRSGVDILPVLLESHSPLDLIIIMLGTNDVKTLYSASPHVISAGMERLVHICKNTCSLPYTSSADAKILIVAPVRLHADPAGKDWYDFTPESYEKSEKLPAYYQAVAERNGCDFLDASAVISAGNIDGIHLDAEGHEALANLVKSTIDRLGV